MALSRSHCWLPVALLACSLAAVATERPDPLNASAAVPTFTPPSAFTGYRGHGDTRLQSWKDANDAVGRIGGWRAYAREASQASRPANAEPVTPAASESTGAPSTPHGAPHHHH